MRRCPCTTPCPTDSPRPCSPIGCPSPSASFPRTGATAASPMSISAPRARRLAVRSAARRTPAAAAKRARMRGRRTCGVRPPPSTGAPSCRSRRESSSTSDRPRFPGPLPGAASRAPRPDLYAALALEPRSHRRRPLLEPRRRDGPQGLDLLGVERDSILLDPYAQRLELGQPALLARHLALELGETHRPVIELAQDLGRLATAREQSLPAALLGLEITRELPQRVRRESREQRRREQSLQMGVGLLRRPRVAPHRARILEGAAHRARLLEPVGQQPRDLVGALMQIGSAALHAAFKGLARARRGRIAEARRAHASLEDSLDELTSRNEGCRRQQQSCFAPERLCELPYLGLETQSRELHRALLEVALRLGEAPVEAHPQRALRETQGRIHRELAGREREPRRLREICDLETLPRLGMLGRRPSIELGARGGRGPAPQALELA